MYGRSYNYINIQKKEGKKVFTDFHHALLRKKINVGLFPGKVQSDNSYMIHECDTSDYVTFRIDSITLNLKLFK